MTCQTGRTPEPGMPLRPFGRPIATRSRCTRPSRLVTVPSFSG